ncbi:MAG TPA: glycoside hydrolase family 15 protein [Tepidisphaeraceae bacterium]|jgi:GH15 family glucan-1,4-alpha-glucosidase|nr:glycoside hydrolase family 15 protein [Tepidisphaeraceae bacterium]
MPDSPAIEDYALIGDLHTAALVARTGSIDWLCLPRFDSGACFAALLGGEEQGHWLVAPAGRTKCVSRRYRPGTLILETEFETDGGAVTLIDFMPRRESSPHIIRTVVGRRGAVQMMMTFLPRFDYGSAAAWIKPLESGHGVRAAAGPDAIYLRTEFALKQDNQSASAAFEIHAGQEVSFTLTWAESHEEEPAAPDAGRALRETDAWWSEWSGRCEYRGKWSEAVVRSLITLKALTFAPTGGVVSAATTSLPEHFGGSLNWDYRYCWLRDATFTLMALDAGGYAEEVAAFRGWLLNAIAGEPDNLQIMFGITGRRRLPELELPWLAGYEKSTPVRVGNDAYRQRQLDVYGEVADAMYQARRMGLGENADMWKAERTAIDWLEKHWTEPDNGIWEMRDKRRQFTHSKVMAWVAMDRAMRMVQEFGQSGEESRWRALRDVIHADVCKHGFDEKLNSFVQCYGSEDADASLLMMPLVGFVPADDPRMIGTIEFIKKQLMRDGLVWRYATDDASFGLPAKDGAFLICCFWMVDNLALLGRREEAEQMFERLLALRNDVGLLSEEYNPKSARLLGNFPQAISHVGLVHSARILYGDSSGQAAGRAPRDPQG